MANILDAGKLRHRIDIYGDRAPDGADQPDYSPPPKYSKIPALVTDLSADESARGVSAQPEAHVTTRVQFRWLANIKPTDRIQFGSRVLNVIKVLNPDGLKMQLDLECKELA